MRYCYKAKIKRVIDGDTLDIQVFLGFKVTVDDRVRLLGVNTPETRTKDLKEKALGLKAKEFVKQRIDKKKVEIDTEKGEGKFGRYLATVYYFDGDKRINLNQELIDNKLAMAYFGKKIKKGWWKSLND